MILCSTTGYQTRTFVEAAAHLSMEPVFGSDRCHVLDDPWQDGALALRFEDPERAANEIAGYTRHNPIAAVVALGDRPTRAAARACRMLGLPFHPPAAVDLCRDKSLFRETLREVGLHTPRFIRFPKEDDAGESADATAARVGFPCVLKPLALAASQGVIRANDRNQFIEAHERISTLLASPHVQVLREETSRYIQVEEYIGGIEIAVEGLVQRGVPKILAVFDKPDPLEGPFFEETIYVTPTRLTAERQSEVQEVLRRAVNALGLFHGPLHGEFRINDRGVWPLELAARPIGGLCARALRFRMPGAGSTVSLEELMIRLACGEDVQGARREECASGVMMIPVREAGVYDGVDGMEIARLTPGVEDVIITAKQGQALIPWPEGCSYPGFIFARGGSPEFVERALRTAHSKLRLCVLPALPVIHS
jgi:biotin carboxylase